MFKISVIVPVYNAEKYLRRCVDSILAQSYKDFELLLVDDGSTDASNVICNEYVEKDCRVRVFHKQNGGVSSARNVGIDYALGEWITFIDSDDWVSESYLYNLFSHIDDGVDLIISYAEIVYSNGLHQKEIYDSKIVTNNYDVLFIENDLNWHTSPWSKLFKNKLCKELRFVEGMHIGEDLVFLYSYIMRCGQIYILGENNYNYDISGSNTLTKRIGKLDVELYAYSNIFSQLNTFIERKSIINEEVLKKINWIKSYYIHRVLNSLYHTPNLSAKDRCAMIYKLDIDIYTRYTKYNSTKEFILQFLLKRKCYRIYDLLRILVSKLKKNVS